MMDSYSMYKEIRAYVERNSHTYNAEKITDMTRRLISCIAKELLTPPFVPGNSTFIAEMQKTLPKNSDRVVIPSGYSTYSRTNSRANFSLDVSIILDVETYLKKGNFDVPMYHTAYISSRRLFRNYGSADWSQTQADGFVRKINNSIENIRLYLERKRELPVPVPVRTQPSAVEDALKAKQRLEENRRSIQEWHESQKSLAGEIAKIQPDISRVLKGFMSFSDTVTEGYVLQFAKMYIGLFNLISDSFEAQKEKSEHSGNKDYFNAVMNYEDF